MVTADHTVTIAFDEDGSQSETFTCHAPPDALCHATYPCGCESWVDEEFVDGLPQHRDWSDNLHVGMADPEVCNFRDWFEGTDDSVTGEVTVPVRPQWEGDYYTFDITPGEEVQP